MTTKITDILPEELDELAKLFGRPVAPEEREFIIHWEKNVRTKVLARAKEPVDESFRWKLGDERKSVTHRFNLKSDPGFKGYLTVGMYPSGRVGEAFLEISKEGSFASGVMDGLMTAVSIGLQYGIPLQAYIDKFINSRFEPTGPVRSAPDGVFNGENNMKIAKSVLDYLARYLQYRFPKGYWEGGV
jgi:ribonucleoside-diphosphate reductase alpha chain